MNEISTAADVTRTLQDAIRAMTSFDRYSTTVAIDREFLLVSFMYMNVFMYPSSIDFEFEILGAGN